MRCIRLDAVGFEHCFPKFGHLELNDPKNCYDYKIPDPPNHEKKRKDEILDITGMVHTDGRTNSLNIYQIQKDHKGFFSHPGHIVGIFLVKTVQPHDLVNYTKSHMAEEPHMSLNRFRSFFSDQTTEQVNFNMCDSVTMVPIVTPVRGEVCTHLQCFDLPTYIEMNAKYKRWQCPFCGKRCSFVKIDSLYVNIINQMNPLRELTDDIDEKITLNKDLSIVFTHDKGKFLARVRPEIGTDEAGNDYLIRYVREAGGPAGADTSMANQETNSAQLTGNQSYAGQSPVLGSPVLGKRPQPEGEEHQEDFQAAEASASVSKV